MCEIDSRIVTVTTLLPGARASAVAASAAIGRGGGGTGRTINGGGAAEDGGTDVWVWPVPRWQGYEPTLSDRFGSKRTGKGGVEVVHRGVDIMFPRRRGAPDLDRYPPRTKHGSRDFFMPDAVPVLAARDAKVWSAGKTSRGYAVVLDHGPPWASYYTHLAELFLVPTERGKSTQRVRAGDVIGHVGADPLDAEGLMHLHFELWYKGGPAAAIDPEPLMRTWLKAPASSPMIATT